MRVVLFSVFVQLSLSLLIYQQTRLLDVGLDVYFAQLLFGISIEQILSMSNTLCCSLHSLMFQRVLSSV